MVFEEQISFLRELELDRRVEKLCQELTLHFVSNYLCSKEDTEAKQFKKKMRQDAFEAEQVINGKIKPDLVEVPPMSSISIKPNLPKKLPQGISFFMTKYMLEAK